MNLSFACGFTAIFALIVATAACGSLPTATPTEGSTAPPARSLTPPATATVVQEMTIDFGATTRRLTTVENPGARQRFLAAYDAGMSAMWRLIVVSAEGDPIIYTLTSWDKGRGITLVRDTTRDRFGPQQIVQYNCSILVQESNRLLLTGCAGKDGEISEQDLPL